MTTTIRRWLIGLSLAALPYLVLVAIILVGGAMVGLFGAQWVWAIGIGLVVLLMVALAPGLVFIFAVLAFVITFVEVSLAIYGAIGFIPTLFLIVTVVYIVARITGATEGSTQ